MPLAEAERAVQRLDTEAKTLMKLLAVETQSMWPPVIDNITVEKGYEIALGAALGDDLDAPVDQSHAMRWMGATVDAVRSGAAGRRAVAGAARQGAAELARRLAQIGVVERADGARLAKLLKPGQRLVSRDGDLWRWDGFAADAHAPTGAARRLAQRSRLSDIDGELAAARAAARRQAQDRRGRAGRTGRGRPRPKPPRASTGARRSAKPTAPASCTPWPSARWRATPRASRR